MQLKNKKTGEIIELLAKPSFVKRNDDYLQSEINTFNSLAELNEEWEDASEEPKKYWYINASGDIASIYEEEEEEEDTKSCKEINNYFETEEEAKLAVRKLKAWKRLKDKGFKPIYHVLDYKAKTAKITFKANWVGDKDPEAEQLYDAFCLLFFGGEDE